MGESDLVPETDREYALCWRIFAHAAPHATKGELRETMIAALIDHRAHRERRLRDGWKDPE